MVGRGDRSSLTPDGGFARLLRVAESPIVQVQVHEAFQVSKLVIGYFCVQEVLRDQYRTTIFVTVGKTENGNRNMLVTKREP